MGDHRILLPYNFTPSDEKAVGFLIQRHGMDPDARVTLFHAYTPVPKLEVSDRTVMGRIAGNLTYLRQKNTELEAEIQKVRNRLVEAGFQDESVHCTFKPQEKDVAQEIIDYAREGKFTTIILNRNPTRIKQYFTASISKKVSRGLPGLNINIVA